ncbi:MAG: hypothetical protein GY870_05565 [archaeon]|nr:hypothetical protein [archaeon]
MNDILKHYLFLKAEKEALNELWEGTTEQPPQSLDGLAKFKPDDLMKTTLPYVYVCSCVCNDGNLTLHIGRNKKLKPQSYNDFCKLEEYIKLNNPELKNLALQTFIFLKNDK